MLRKFPDLVDWIRDIAQRRRGTRALAGWNDRELADVGILRFQMPGAPREPWPNLSKSMRANCCGFRGDAVPQGCR
jgi:uncharacterized protein YjiS (DUF1127 family)